MRATGDEEAAAEVTELGERVAHRAITVAVVAHLHQPHRGVPPDDERHAGKESALLDEGRRAREHDGPASIPKVGEPPFDLGEVEWWLVDVDDRELVGQRLV